LFWSILGTGILGIFGTAWREDFPVSEREFPVALVPANEIRFVYTAKLK